MMRFRYQVVIMDAVLVVFFCSALFALFRFWIQPNLERVRQEAAARHQYRVAAGALRDLGEQRKRLAERFETRVDALDAQYRSLPPSDELSETLARLSDTSMTGDLVINELAPGELQPAGPYAVAAVELKTSGAFHSVVDWLHAMELGLPDAGVSSVVLNRVDRGDTTTIQAAWTINLLLREGETDPKTEWMHLLPGA